MSGNCPESAGLCRNELVFHPLKARHNRVSIDRDIIMPDNPPPDLTNSVSEGVRLCAARILAARSAGKPVILAFGAHTIKNGLGPLLIRLMERRWVTHLATNGAGVIHDWELSWQGETSEHVEENLQEGRFGAWEETGYYINLAILTGSYRGLGYGESVGAMISDGRIEVPASSKLRKCLNACAGSKSHFDIAAAGAAADLLEVKETVGLPEGTLNLDHPYRDYSPQAAARRLGVPFTAHPMIGHDIIYMHPLCHGGAVGRAAMRDFLRFAESVSGLEGGVYLSIGSAVMSPMIFEKSMSMAQNLAVQHDKRIENHFIAVVDLQESTWDWDRGEPPEGYPDYYLRFYKTFRRMGGVLNYTCADNRDFLLSLCHQLEAGA